MRILLPELRREPDAVTISTPVELGGESTHLWYAVPPEYERYLTTDRLDAAVVGLLMRAMRDREDIYAEGPMSEKLFYNLTNYYMPILTGAFPWLHRVKLIPAQLDRAAPSASTSASASTSTLASASTSPRGGVATGFSGGVDSFCVLADHLWGKVPAGYRITHLLFHNVGSHAQGGRRLFEERFASLLPAAREMGLPFIKIDSNLDELLPGFSYIQSFAPRNVSAVLNLQKLIGRYLYASGQRYEDCHGGRTEAMGFFDPLGIPLLSTEALESIPTGSQYSRVAKTELVAGLPLTWRYLEVCISPERAGNCSNCWKCKKTMLTLEMLGVLDRYKSVFDLSRWQQNRIPYMGRVLLSRDVLLKEIVKSAKERGWRFPAAARYWKARYRLQGVLDRSTAAAPRSSPLPTTPVLSTSTSRQIKVKV